MKRFGILLSVLMLALTTAAAPAAPKTEAPKKDVPRTAKAGSFLRLDYYVWSRWEKLGGPNKEQIKDLDVAVFFSPLKPDAQGHLAVSDEFVRALENLKAAKNEKTRIWLGLGSLADIAKDESALATFITELRALCDKLGFSGVDIDWEDAGTPPEEYARVVKRIADDCHSRKRMVSNSHATAPVYVKKTAACVAHLDYVNIQCYYSTNNGMTVETLSTRLARFEKAGVPRGKILIGLPVYGMVDMNKDRGVRRTTIGYRSLLEKGADPSASQWTDPETSVAYHYSGSALIKAKLDYAKSQGYAGVFTWEMTLDAPYSSPHSILRILGEGTKK